MDAQETSASDGDARRALMRTMVLIRALEKAWGDAYLNEEITGIPPSLVHWRGGHRRRSLRRARSGDFVFTTHRGQAAQVARGLDPNDILAE